MILAPSSQNNLFGYKIFFNELVSLYKRDKFPNKILFSGEKGIGKCTASYHFINYVLSLNEDHPYDLKNFQINPENKSFKLIVNKSNPNFYLIDVAVDKKNINIDQIRHLILSLNKSSFNLKPRFVLIDNVEFLNINSINALLKIIEEPNDNINFILINNNKNILPTLKSRCLNFKMSLTFDESIIIIDKILNKSIFDLLNKDLIFNYSTPGQLYDLVNFSNLTDLDLKKINLKDFLLFIIVNKYFKQETSIKDLTFTLIELYFRKNISVRNIKLISIYSYFLKKINNTKKFNLDEESLFMEFEDRVLNG